MFPLGHHEKGTLDLYMAISGGDQVDCNTDYTGQGADQLGLFGGPYRLVKGQHSHS